MSSVGGLLMRQNVPKRSYITTAAFADHIYSYFRNYDAGTYTWSGDLSGVSIPGGLDRAGVILRETGRKLYPTANPGVTRYMVGVYHEDIGTGFIDPNCSVFATFNTDKPEYIPNNTDDDYAPIEDQGNPVFTLGDITTTKGNMKANVGSLYVSSDAGATGSVLVGPNAALAAGVDNAIVVNATATADNQIITSGPIVAGTTITATKQIRSSTVTNYNTPPVAHNGTLTIDATAGQVFLITLAANGDGTPSAQQVRIDSTVPPQNAGAVIYLYFTVQDPNGANLTFGDFMLSGGGSSAVSLANGNHSFTFVCDSNNFWETSRTLNIV